MAAGLGALGLRHGDHLLTVLQNRWETATLHWACQIAGIIITPLNWRAKADEIDWCIGDAEIGAVIYDDVSAESVCRHTAAQRLPRIMSRDKRSRGRFVSPNLLRQATPHWRRAPSAEDWSLMLYTSGTTSRPKGVPRRHRAERAAAVAHVAQNLYAPWRAHAGRHAAVSHDGRALAAGNVADRRLLRLPARASTAGRGADD